MRKALALCLSLLLLAASPLGAESKNRQAQTDKNLRINRLLLTQYSRELADLRQKQRQEYSEAVHERTLGLRIKIQALKEDAERLKSHRSMNKQADAFLDNFVKLHGQQTFPAKPKPVFTPELKPMPIVIEPIPTPTPVLPKPVAALPAEPLLKLGSAPQPKPAPQAQPMQQPETEPKPEQVPQPEPPAPVVEAIQAEPIAAPPIPAPKPLTAQQKENERLHEEALKLVAARDLKQAARKYEEIVVDNPEDDEAYLLLGHVYLMLGDYDKAEFAYYNAVHIDRANYDEVIPFYQNLVVQSPNNDEAYQFLGYAYVILGDASRAKDAYQEALRINPGNMAARKGLSLVAQRFGL